jgi:hypothetical protein
MALSSISTELDAAITGYLVGHTTALAALSRTSKYYRSLAEPLLYRMIDIQNYLEFRIKRLLMTLLDSPQKGRYIESFTITRPLSKRINSNSEEEVIATKIIRQDLGRYRSMVSKAIDHVGLECKTMASQWAQDIFGGIGQMEIVAFFRNTVNATSALVLSMACNIEQVHCLGPDFHTQMYTLKVLAPQSHPQSRVLSC